MASLQAYQSHGRRYYRIVESFRQNGKPRLRVLLHLGRAEDVLRRVEGQRSPFQVTSVSAGAVTALYTVARQLDVAGQINRALEQDGQGVQKRDGLRVGETLLAGLIGRACAPCSKRAFAGWAAQTYLPELMGFAAEELTSEHFWEQMDALPEKLLGSIEQELVRRVVEIEQLQLQALAYDTTNFYTHIASTNARAQLPQRGHNKQRRHDLRQLGLALVVDQATQLPLAHQLYEGARSDMKSFAAFLQPLRERLRALAGRAEQLTLVFDAGAASKKNLESLEPGPDYYVTSLRPSDHLALLREAAPQLAEVTLSSGSRVRAWRSRRRIAGKEREVVVVFSPQLYEGQLRGLQQHSLRVSEELKEMGLHPRGTPAAVRKRIAKICARQYIRTLVRYEVFRRGRGRVEVRLWSDLEEYRRLQTRYFGLRLLVSNHREWSTAQIMEAYRGQAKAESAFRDLKDPGMLATRPQFHWTDQKLQVHAFMCVTGYLLVRLLWWRARRRTNFAGSPHHLLSELSRIRCCRLIEKTGRAGRPRVHWQLEEMERSLRELGQHLQALPRLPQEVVYTP